MGAWNFPWMKSNEYKSNFAPAAGDVTRRTTINREASSCRGDQINALSGPMSELWVAPR